MKVIAYTRPEDGGLSIVHTGADLDDAALAALAAKTVPSGVPFQLLDRAALPATRVDRDGWKLSADGKAVEVDAALKSTITASKAALAASAAAVKA